MEATKIDVGKLPLKIARNYVVMEQLVITNLKGVELPQNNSLEREPIQNGVIRGLGPIAYGEGYRRGNHVLFRRGAATEFKLRGDKFLLIFSSDIVAVKLEGPAPDHEEEVAKEVAKGLDLNALRKKILKEKEGATETSA